MLHFFLVLLYQHYASSSPAQKGETYSQQVLFRSIRFKVFQVRCTSRSIFFSVIIEKGEEGDR